MGDYGSSGYQARPSGGGGNATVPIDAPIAPSQAAVDFALGFLEVGGYEWSAAGLGMTSFSPETADYIANVLNPFNEYAGPLEYDFSNNSLDVASINGILAGFAAHSGITTATLKLQGGTNAAPTGQGVTDKSALIGNGWTVTTN